MLELKFPKNFLWGAATAAHQVEGGNNLNDWWLAEARGLVPHQSGDACKHFEKFSEDFDIAKKLAHNAHRFSIEWSRIEPSPGKFSEEAIVHYRKIILQLRERGIEPVVTLHHFTNPVWFSELGGFENRSSAKFFARYVEFVVKHLGDYVNWWITINEPTIYISLGYIIAKWPPFKKNKWASVKVFLNLVRAHRLAHAIIHKHKASAKVSVAHNVSAYVPAHSYNIFEKAAARVLNFLGNDLFLVLARKLDFLGVNYYFIKRVSLTPGINFVARPNAPVSDLGWEIAPAGLLEVLRRLHKYRLPILITENGLADSKDDRRFSYILNHLLMIYVAVTEGIDVKGYLHWSLMDNFEWAEGFDPRFGLIEINYQTYERKIRSSAEKFSVIIKQNAISVDDLESYISKNIDSYPPVLQRYLLKITRIKPTATGGDHQ